MRQTHKRARAISMVNAPRKPSGIGVEPEMRDYFLSFFASSVIAWPALDTSLPAPSTVLHALNNVDAPVRTTKPMRAIVSFLRMTTPLVL